jgi:hypothetical protein
MDVSIIRVGAAEAEEFPGRIHHRAAAGLPGRWRANQSHEVACFWSAELNGRFISAPAVICDSAPWNQGVLTARMRNPTKSQKESQTPRVASASPGFRLETSF